MVERREIFTRHHPPRGCGPVTAIVLMTLVLASCGRYDWQTHASPDGRYRADFPGRPGSHELRGPGQLDNGILRVEDTYEDDILLQVAWIELPAPPSDTEDATQLLFGLSRSAASQFTGQPKRPDIDPASVSDVPGWPQPHIQIAIPFSRDDIRRMATRRYLIAGQRLYMVTAITPHDAVDHPMVRRFFDSFELIQQ
jgi:hypothetical protein